MNNLHWLPNALRVAVALRRAGLVTPIVQRLSIAPMINELILIAENAVYFNRPQFLQRMRDIVRPRYYDDIVSALSTADDALYEEYRSMMREILFER